ncbi:MAG: hypothetical protein ACOY0T_24305 [Myxococcota bacterium]
MSAKAAGIAARFCLLFVFVFALMRPSSLCAEPRRTAIALVTVGADPELHARIRAEINTLGWRVTEIAPGGDVALAQIARRARTLAVLRVVRGAEGIELWVAPEVDAQARSEWIDVDPRRPELAVVRAVESLRARFIELGIEPEASNAPAAGTSSSGSPNPTTSASPSANSSPSSAPLRSSSPGSSASPSGTSGTVPSAEPPKDYDEDFDISEVIDPGPRTHFPPRVWLAVAGGALQSTTVGSLHVGVTAAVRLQPTRNLATGVELWLPATAARMEDKEGSADVRATLAGASIEYRTGSRRWEVGVGAGAAFAIVNVQGYPKEGFAGRRENLYAALPFGRLFCGYALSRSLYLRIDGTVGVSQPRVGIQFDQNVIAYWAQPLISGTLGLEWAPFVK